MRNRNQIQDQQILTWRMTFWSRLLKSRPEINFTTQASPIVSLSLYVERLIKNKQIGGAKTLPPLCAVHALKIKIKLSKGGLNRGSWGAVPHLACLYKRDQGKSLKFLKFIEFSKSNSFSVTKYVERESKWSLA